MKPKNKKLKQVLSSVTKLLKIVLQREISIKVDVDLPSERFGSDYGGWNVITNNINSSSIIYSFGVGEDASFDIALIKRFGLLIYAFDPTPKSVNYVREQSFSDNFMMHQYGLADFDGLAVFCPPDNPSHASYTLLDRSSTKDNSISMPVKKLSTIMNELRHNKIDLLKMDIEGAEYNVIKDLKNTSILPNQILVEFHHRFPNVGIKKTLEAIECIKTMGYKLFFVSASKEEYSFIKSC